MYGSTTNAQRLMGGCSVRARVYSMENDAMTLHQIWSKVKAHMLQQGRKSSNSIGDCFYRGPDGLTCAVGCLIPEELYDISLEGKRVTAGSVVDTLKLAGINATDDGTQALLSDLQSIHDEYDPIHWEFQLSLIEPDDYTLEEKPQACTVNCEEEPEQQKAYVYVNR